MPVPEVAVIEPEARLGCAASDRLDRRAGPGALPPRARDDEARFGYAVGPHSWKQFLLPPRLRLWRLSVVSGLEVEEEPRTIRRSPSSAFGPVSCRRSRSRTVSDRGPYVDRDYAARREDAFVVAVELRRARRRPASAPRWEHGPGQVHAGYRPVALLTELLDGRGHRLLVRGRQPRAAQRCSRRSSRGAPRSEADRSGRRPPRSRGRGGDRSAATLDAQRPARPAGAGTFTTTAGRRSRTAASPAATAPSVCPTCFCTAVEDVNRPRGRARQSAGSSWDYLLLRSSYAHLHGGSRPHRRRARATGSG